ncbi:MAG: precorrin-3B C17-methyltransferase / cobalt-factor methyltransferase [Eubacteriales bacterium]|nr:precorrin-3B C17-methyltransferase / cobalt-factor methyltransferase [Eubacteriales bacterium]
MTLRAVLALREADRILAYRTYAKLIRPLVRDKEVIVSGMRQEVERARQALQLARQGYRVAVVSSGDAGLYGMAGIVLEVMDREGGEAVEVEVVPGVSSAFAAAALLGAPLMHDTAFISLSDLLTPQEDIRRRLEKAAEGDFVVALYNPVSHRRTRLIREAVDVFRRFRRPDTPVGIVRHAMREGQEVIITTLDKLLDHQLDMFTLIIVGNSQTYVTGGRMITPRGYKL